MNNKNDKNNRKELKRYNLLRYLTTFLHFPQSNFEGLQITPLGNNTDSFVLFYKRTIRHKTQRISNLLINLSKWNTLQAKLGIQQESS